MLLNGSSVAGLRASRREAAAWRGGKASSDPTFEIVDRKSRRFRLPSGGWL
jgi:hypothetical protein